MLMRVGWLCDRTLGARSVAEFGPSSAANSARVLCIFFVRLFDSCHLRPFHPLVRCRQSGGQAKRDGRGAELPQTYNTKCLNIRLKLKRVTLKRNTSPEMLRLASFRTPSNSLLATHSMRRRPHQLARLLLYPRPAQPRKPVVLS